MFEHYYTENPSSKLKVKEIELVLPNEHKYKFKTPSGVYSFGKIDKASKVLLETLLKTDSINNGKVLDIGCGYGLVGVTLKKEYPNIKLFMSDINKRAVEFAKINLNLNNIDAKIKQGNLYEIWKDVNFDHIVSNPPIVAGKDVWMKLVSEAPEHLEKNGTLTIVAYHNKGGKRIRDFMKRIFGNVRELIKQGGIRVYQSTKL